ncbi:MAG: hypothetical protein RL328_1464 [Acidobacteriota bacterium]
MKRKRPTIVKADGEAPQNVIPDALLEQAKRAIEAERARKSAACVVCGGECTSDAPEGLCWVCRRLKLSAWRDTDSQMPMQE